MFTKFTTFVCAIAVMAIIGSTAQAGHHNARYRQLDDFAFAAYVEARELRWELHDDFVDSHDYDHLLEDAEDVLIAMQGLQNSILRERSDALIEREVNIVMKKLSDLTVHLNGSDFARGSRSRHRTTFNGRGYVFTPETQHVGRVHVDAALKMIAKIETALDALAHEVEHRHNHHRSVSPTEVAPAPLPVLVPSEVRYRGGRSLGIPVGKSGAGNLVFRVDF